MNTRRRLKLISIILSILIIYIVHREKTNSTIQLDTKLEYASDNKNRAYLYRFEVKDELSNRCNQLLDERQNNFDVNRSLYPQDGINYFLENSHVERDLCIEFRNNLNLDEIPVSIIEKDFPIAFAFMIYRDIDRFARLLRMTYRSQNFYAIHVDRKSSEKYFDAVIRIQKCFGDNVYVIPRTESIIVTWRTYSQLEVELLLARKLLLMGEWKYVINLTGQEFPLRTNLEIVMALKALNGSNLVDGILRNNNTKRIPNTELNFSVHWIKGSVHCVLNRAFTQFMLFDQRAMAISNALKTGAYYQFPDESFYVTLANNPQLGAPGACLEINRDINNMIDPKRLPDLMRYKIWRPEFCSTKYQRSICMLGSPHLKSMFHTEKLFANKFLPDYFPEAYDCLELMIAKRAKLQLVFNTSSYKNLYCTTAHI